MKQNFSKYAAIAAGTEVVERYILDRNYDQVKKCISGDDTVRVKFTGPKGVGKSSALLTLWAESLLSEKSCVFVGMEALSGYSTSEVRQYFSTLFDCTGARSLVNRVEDYIEKKTAYYILILLTWAVQKKL